MCKNGDELITFLGEPVGYSVRDFWSWNCSDLLDNTLRGEYGIIPVKVSSHRDAVLRALRRSVLPPQQRKIPVLLLLLPHEADEGNGQRPELQK